MKQKLITITSITFLSILSNPTSAAGYIKGAMVLSTELEFSDFNTTSDDGDGLSLFGRYDSESPLSAWVQYVDRTWDFPGQSVDLNEIHLGVGACSSADTDVQIWGGVEMVQADFKPGPNENGYGLRVGIAALPQNQVSILASAAYVDLEETNYTEFSGGLNFMFTKSVGGFAELVMRSSEETFSSGETIDYDTSDVRVGVIVAF